MTSNPRWSPPVPGERTPRAAVAVVLLWLCFTAFPIVDFLRKGPGVGHAIVVMGLAALFVGSYVHAMLGQRRLPGPKGWPYVVVLGSVTVALLLVDGSRWTAMAVFTAAAAGRRLEPRPAVGVIALMAGVAGATALIGDKSTANALVLALTTVGIGYWALGFTRALVANEELREAQAEIARLAVADERLRFARDLHDLLGHSLSVIAIKSELAGRLLLTQPAAAAEQVTDIEAVSRRALAEVREAVAGYRRPVLAEELEGARAALTGAGIAVDVDAPALSLPADAEAVLAWAIREGATNALRHAAAQRVSISLRAGPQEATVEVLDDGDGASADGGGTGLAGLAERVARVRGRMEAAPAAGGGFRLAVAVPLEPAP
jgi:two-component system sensor histidine kinase DesK